MRKERVLASRSADPWDFLEAESRFNTAKRNFVEWKLFGDGRDLRERYVAVAAMAGLELDASTKGENPLFSWLRRLKEYLFGAGTYYGFDQKYGVLHPREAVRIKQLYEISAIFCSHLEATAYVTIESSPDRSVGRSAASSPNLRRVSLEEVVNMKLADPKKYPYMTVRETLVALGKRSRTTISTYLDEGKLEALPRSTRAPKNSPRQITTESILRYLSETVEE